MGRTIASHRESNYASHHELIDLLSICGIVRVAWRISDWEEASFADNFCACFCWKTCVKVIKRILIDGKRLNTCRDGFGLCT